MAKLNIKFIFELNDNELDLLAKTINVENDDKLKNVVERYISEMFEHEYNDCVNFVDLFDNDTLSIIKEMMEGE